MIGLKQRYILLHKAGTYNKEVYKGCFNVSFARLHLQILPLIYYGTTKVLSKSHDQLIKTFTDEAQVRLKWGQTWPYSAIGETFKLLQKCCHNIVGAMMGLLILPWGNLVSMLQSSRYCQIADLQLHQHNKWWGSNKVMYCYTRVTICYVLHLERLAVDTNHNLLLTIVNSSIE